MATSSIRWSPLFALGLAGLSACSSATPRRSRAAFPGPARDLAGADGPREQTADQQVLQVLNRLTFGPRPGDVEAVRAMGVDAWIAQQLAPGVESDSTARQLLAPLATLGRSGAELLRAYPPAGVVQQQLARRTGTIAAADSAQLRAAVRAANAVTAELSASRVIRAVLAERQLDEVMVDFWENHFTVFAGKDRVRYFIPEFEATAIRPYAMGRFRELLGAVAKSPAMLMYLDNWQSVADSGRATLRTLTVAQERAVARLAAQRAVAAGVPRPTAMTPGPSVAAPARRRGLNENYARELMELHTLGVDGGYTQQDVVAVARALTGWTLANGANGGPFVFRPAVHDAEPKIILGQTFRAGGGQEEGEAVLDLLARHPATARFIATKLARRFVSDTPPPALVTRAATTFLRTDGDIRAVVRTIVTSPEFFAAASFRAKVKTPFELVVSAMRALHAVPDTTPRIAQLVGRLGQPLFGHQAPNGYPETGDAWMNTGAILNRINFGVAVAEGRVPGVRLAAWPAARALVTLPRDGQVDGVIRELLGGAVSSDTRQVLLTGTNPFLQARGRMATDSLGGMAEPAPPPSAPPPRPQQQLAQIVGLALGAPEFQRR